MAKRHPQWRTRLAAALLTAAARPFQWGGHDCCSGLAGPAIDAVIGIDLAAQFKGQYSTAAGAIMALKSAGYDDVLAFMASHFEVSQSAFARVGDLAAIKSSETGWGMGVVLGARIAVLSPDGYATVDLAQADHIYRVG